jgi:hypothetical protein
LQVKVDFLAPKELKLKKNHPKLLDGFRYAARMGMEDSLELAIA